MLCSQRVFLHIQVVLSVLCTCTCVALGRLTCFTHCTRAITSAQSGSGAGSNRPHRPGIKVYPLRNMAPSPRRHTASPRASSQATPDKSHIDTISEDTDITWNTATAKLPAFISALDKNDTLLSSAHIGLLSSRLGVGSVAESQGLFPTARLVVRLYLHRNSRGGDHHRTSTSMGATSAAEATMKRFPVVICTWTSKKKA